MRSPTSCFLICRFAGILLCLGTSSWFCLRVVPGRDLPHAAALGLQRQQEGLCEMVRPEVLSLACDKVSEHQQASTIQFCLKSMKVLEPGTSPEVCAGLGECRIIWRTMLLYTEAVPNSLGFRALQMTEQKHTFFYPQSVVLFCSLSWLDLYRSQGISSLN